MHQTGEIWPHRFARYRAIVSAACGRPLSSLDSWEMAELYVVAGWILLQYPVAASENEDCRGRAAGTETTPRVGTRFSPSKQPLRGSSSVLVIGFEGLVEDAPRADPERGIHLQQTDVHYYCVRLSRVS
jgi:hypothetical protein